MLFLQYEIIKLDERSINMKKLILLISLFCVATFTVNAQDDLYNGSKKTKENAKVETQSDTKSSLSDFTDREIDEYNRHYAKYQTNEGDVIDVLPESGEDDMYFVPKKTSKKKKAKMVVDDNSPTYYVGSNRNVDEYNRHKKLVSTYQKIGSDSLGNDIIRIFSSNEIYPDTSYVDTLFMVSKYVNNDDDYRYSNRLSRWDDYYYVIPYDLWRSYNWWGFRDYYWPAWYGRHWAWNYHRGYFGYYDPWYFGYGYFDPWFDPWYMSLYYGGYYDPFFSWYTPWWYYRPWYYTGVYYGGGYGGHGGRPTGTGAGGGRGDIRYTGIGTHNHSRSATGGIGGSVHSTSNRNVFSRNTGGSSGIYGYGSGRGSSTTRTYTTNSSGAKFGGSRSTTTYSGDTRSYSTPSFSNSSSSSSLGGSSYSGGSSGGGSYGGGGRSGGGGGGSFGGGGGGGGRSGGGSFGGHR